MTLHERFFLAALRAALTGDTIPPETDPEMDWQAWITLAQTHRVMPLVCQAVQPTPACLVPFRAALRRQVAQQVLRTHQFLPIYRQLHEAGVRPVVVKGIVCRSLYPMPDLRPSSDEDLLIPRKQLDTARAILRERGLEEEGSGMEWVFRDDRGTVRLELHGEVFPGAEAAYGNWNGLFEGIFDRAVEFSQEDARLQTLCPQDHLLYLVLHAMKHFLHSGVGIRQVCDICLFANAHGKTIDWERLLEQCRQVRGDKFAAALFAIGRKYLVFSPEEAGYPALWQQIEPEELPLLEDILQAGLYGDATLDRKRSSHMTLDAASGKKPGLLRTAFPERGRLSGTYPYLQKHPWLLPAAWVQRLWRYAFSRGDPSESARIAKKRVKLLSFYGITPQERYFHGT